MQNMHFFLLRCARFLLYFVGGHISMHERLPARSGYAAITSGVQSGRVGCQRYSWFGEGVRLRDFIGGAPSVGSIKVAVGVLHTRCHTRCPLLEERTVSLSPIAGQRVRGAKCRWLAQSRRCCRLPVVEGGSPCAPPTCEKTRRQKLPSSLRKKA